MKRSFKNWAILGGVASLAACATLAARKAPQSDSEVIRMSHKVHAENEVECRACHGAIYESESLAQGRVMPKERGCLRCHGDWKEEGDCQKCHVTEKPMTWPARQRTVNFSHASHIDLVDEDCAKCHTRLPEPGSTERFTPPMDTCLSCHNHKRDYDQGRCMPCHVDLTRVPLRPVAYFSHQGNYLREHRADARSSPQACAQCHDPTFCTDCHAQTVAVPPAFKIPERVDRQLIHRNDYVSRHAIEARADPALCRRCHGTSYCQTCHTQMGLTDRAQNPRNPHPAGWNMPGQPNFHGPAARRDIVSCAGCHDRGAATNCVACHRVGGLGGNPHPASFMSRYRPGDWAGKRMCLTCHQ